MKKQHSKKTQMNFSLSSIPKPFQWIIYILVFLLVAIIVASAISLLQMRRSFNQLENPFFSSEQQR